MANAEQRLRMAKAIVNFEARRDKDGHLKIYMLPPDDGGGKYEVAGINERYNKETADALVNLINQKKFDEAETLATEFIAEDTDRAATWTRIPGIESYLRDCMFNRGRGGAARILQRALGVNDDGAVGKQTKDAMSIAENKPADLLTKLRAAREQYERDPVGRDETSHFWAGLVNRWNKALEIAKSFPMTKGTPDPAIAQPFATGLALAGLPGTAPELSTANPTLPALRIGMSGSRVVAWQTFLTGQGFTVGAIDGGFGERTQAATAAFQSRWKLTSDGVAGRETLLKAAALGFELIEEPATDNTSSNFPPRPAFGPLVTNAQREGVFGQYDFVSAPTHDNPEAIRILGSWETDNIANVPIPQLQTALGKKAPRTMQFHRLAVAQLQGLWNAWEATGLLNRVLSYDGAYNPRFVRGSRTTLSNHAFGSAFDINLRFNKLGERPALVGEKGSVRELVSIANEWGFWWGGHFDNRKDGMHFEIAFIKK